MSNTPKVSVITVVYNAEKLIERTLLSVLGQSYKNIESLIIDGKSKDQTLAVVAQFKDDRIRVISEADKGIYDAMNKGIKNATGEYIIFINAGDEFYDSATLANILNNQSKNADVYYGNTVVVNEKGEVLGDRRLAPPENLNWQSLQFGMCVSHQSILAKREIAPEYNLSYKISADIDWTIRLLKQAKSIINTHQYVSKFLEGGVSSSRRKQGLKERFAIMRDHYGLARTLMNHAFITLRFVKHLFTKRSMT